MRRFNLGSRGPIAPASGRLEVGRRGINLPAWIALALLCGMLAPNAMLTESGPPDDDWLYAYFGWLMRHGYAPYRQAWDEKGPLLYYLNWLGWVITPHSTMGIGLLQVLAYAAAFLMLFLIMRRIARPAAIAGVTLFSLAFIAFSCVTGDMTESWAVAPIALAAFVVFQALADGPRVDHAILIATAFTATFWMRPDLSLIPGLAALFFVYHLARERIPIARASGIIAVGIVTAMLEAGGLLYIVWRDHALGQMWVAYFIYEKAYGGAVSTLGRMLHAVNFSLTLLRLPLAIAGVLGCVALVLNSRRRAQSAPEPIRDRTEGLLLLSLPAIAIAGAAFGLLYPHRLAFLWPALLMVSLIALQLKVRGFATRSDALPPGYRGFLVAGTLLQFGICLAAGRPYPHYLLPLWPMLAIGACIFGEWLAQIFRAAMVSEGLPRFAGAACGLCLAVVMVIDGARIVRGIEVASTVAPEPAAVARYIDRVTSEDDRVLAIGDGRATQVALLARRLPPTRYFYQVMMVLGANQASLDQRREFLAEVRRNEAQVIFSMPSPVGNLCRPASVSDRAEGLAYGYAMDELPAELQPILKRNYKLEPQESFKAACVYLHTRSPSSAEFFYWAAEDFGAAS